MEMKIKTSLLILLLAVISFCKVGCDSNVENEMNLLMKTWTHSYEEDVAGKMVFRPADYTIFAPSRYRKVIQLKKDNVCYYLVLAPNDAHYMEEGKWKYSETEKKLQIRNAINELKFDYKVLRLESDILVLSN